MNRAYKPVSKIQQNKTTNGISFDAINARKENEKGTRMLIATKMAIVYNVSSHPEIDIGR